MESINELPDPAVITENVEHVETGETVVFNDSLLISKVILNYWTTFNIDNEQTYCI